MTKNEKPQPVKKIIKKKESKSLFDHIREWTDPLIIAFILAMFIRLFVVELFKIPSGSMTPTLIGDYITELDYDDDGDDDLIVLPRQADRIQVFYKEDGKYINNEWQPVSKLTRFSLDPIKLFRLREDKILVNKFAYWFSAPKRGDIAVFKVPKKDNGMDPWDPDKPYYIKRVVGLPNEEVSIANGHVYIDKKSEIDVPQIAHNEYTNDGGYTSKQVPDGEIFMFGDNSRNSLDSRYWGGVPLENFRGKAIFRYAPFKVIGFLK